MRITYRTLAKLLARLTEEQLDTDLTVEIPSKNGIDNACYAADLRIAGEDHDGGLDDSHPVIFTHMALLKQRRRQDVDEIAKEIGIPRLIPFRKPELKD